MNKRTELKNKLGMIHVEESGSSDNLGIVLISYFESHLDRPEDDEESESGWGVWAVEKADKALDRIIKELENNG